MSDKVDQSVENSMGQRTEDPEDIEHTEDAEEPVAEAEAVAVESDAHVLDEDVGQASDIEEVGDAFPEAEAGDNGDPMDQLQSEFDELNDRHLRLAAEFSNFRRRSEGERIDTWTRAQSDLLRQMLDALDDLQRVGGWEADTTTVESLVEGVDLVERKFRQALEAVGVEVIDPVDEAFDPNLMEGMMRVPAESEEQDDVVQQVFQKGYSLNGHLVRPARVSVFKHG
jgi:molecular chaperone GrpE